MEWERSPPLTRLDFGIAAQQRRAVQRQGSSESLSRDMAAAGVVQPTEEEPLQKLRVPPPSLSAFHTVHMKCNLFKHLHRKQ